MSGAQIGPSRPREGGTGAGDTVEAVDGTGHELGKFTDSGLLTGSLTPDFRSQGVAEHAPVAKPDTKE